MRYASETPRKLTEITGARLLICVLGSFRVVFEGEEILVSWGAKTVALLSGLALRDRFQASGESLMGDLWPEEREESRARSALSSLVGDVRKRFRAALGGASLIVSTSGGYGLNTDCGVDVDAVRFAALAEEGERRRQQGDAAGAVCCWLDAVALYGGDLCAADDMRMLIERERLRSLHQLSLACLADHFVDQGDDRTALGYAYRLLDQDPCCEQAHRLVMRCYARLGRRPLALRQYKTCEQILSAEYQARPEPATQALFDQLRHGHAHDCPE